MEPESLDGRLQALCDHVWDRIVAGESELAQQLVQSLSAEYRPTLQRVVARATAYMQSVAPVPPVAEQLPPVLRYLKPLGSGGMGQVYLCEQTSLRRQVALKVLTGPQDERRLEREARLAASFSSRHIVQIHDLVTLKNGRSAIVMEFVRGDSLQSRLAASDSPLGQELVLNWMRQCAEGMQELSNAGIVHRDLKPGNLLLDASDHIKIVDFGLATQTSAHDQLTIEGQVLGTPLYMSPEQAEHPQGMGSSSDIYSFGATFYHALTGVPPFTGKSMLDVLLKHRTEPLTSPLHHQPNLCPGLVRVLEQCLAKDARDRYRSFDELRQALESINVGSTIRRSSAGPEPTEPTPTHHWAALVRRCLDPGQPDGMLEELRCGHGRRLLIVRGDICDQQVDALVSSDDNYLTMGGGVSLAIARAAGSEMVGQARRLVPVLPGRVVVTTAGNLPSRFVLHAVTLRMEEVDSRLFRDQRFAPTRDLVLDLLRSCEYHIETLGIESIAFPLLGTGAGWLSPEICLETMLEALVRLLRFGATPLKEVRLMIRHNRRWKRADMVP